MEVESGNLISEFQYGEDVIGVLSIQGLFDKSAIQIETNVLVEDIKDKYTSEPISLSPNEWVTISNYYKEPNEAFFSSIELITENKEIFVMDNRGLLMCFDNVMFLEDTLPIGIIKLKDYPKGEILDCRKEES